MRKQAQILRTLSNVHRGDTLVYDDYYQRVMRVYSNGYTKKGNIILKLYELPNIAPKSFYNIWRYIFYTYNTEIHNYLRKCDEGWWEDVHFEGAPNEERLRELRNTYLDTELQGINERLGKGRHSRIPKHLQKEKRSISW